MPRAILRVSNDDVQYYRGRRLGRKDHNRIIHTRPHGAPVMPNLFAALCAVHERQVELMPQHQDFGLLSFPKIISGRSDDVVRTELAWQR